MSVGLSGKGGSGSTVGVAVGSGVGEGVGSSVGTGVVSSAAGTSEAYAPKLMSIISKASISERVFFISSDSIAHSEK